MVHKHHPDKLRARRLRAAQRGFLRTFSKIKDGASDNADIALSSELVQDVGVDIFVSCDPWANANSSTYSDIALCSEPIPEKGVDIFVCCDPWANAKFSSAVDLPGVAEYAEDAWCEYLPPVPPPGIKEPAMGEVLDPRDSLIMAQNDTIALLKGHLENLALYGFGCFFPVAWCGVGSASDAWHNAIDLQRHDGVKSKSCGTAPRCEPYDFTQFATRLHQLESDVKKLVANMGECIQQSLDYRISKLQGSAGDERCKRLETLYEELNCALQTSCHDTKTLVSDVVSHCRESVSESISAARVDFTSHIIDRVTDLFRKYDAVVDRKLGKLSCVACCSSEDNTFKAEPLSSEIRREARHGNDASIKLADIEPTSIELEKLDPEAVCDNLVNGSSPQRVDAESVENCSLSDPSFGDTVKIFGLENSAHFNDRFGTCLGVDAQTGRFIVKFTSEEAPIKVKSMNLQFPARCTLCDSEVTSSKCFACPNGSMSSHAAKRDNDTKDGLSASEHDSELESVDVNIERVAVNWQL